MSVPEVNYGIVRELLPNQVHVDIFYAKKERGCFDAKKEFLGDDGICIWGNEPKTSLDLKRMVNEEATKL